MKVVLIIFMMLVYSCTKKPIPRIETEQDKWWNAYENALVGNDKAELKLYVEEMVFCDECYNDNGELLEDSIAQDKFIELYPNIFRETSDLKSTAFTIIEIDSCTKMVTYKIVDKNAEDNGYNLFFKLNDDGNNWRIQAVFRN